MSNILPLVHWKKIKTFPDKQLQGKFCLSPFRMIEVTTDGDVRLCGCAGWMPTTVGNLLDYTLEELLESDLAQSIRQSIIDGTYKYCNLDNCAVYINNGLNTIDTVPPHIADLLKDSAQYQIPAVISFQGDRTCNLSCPSCRTSVYKTPAEQQQKQLELGEKMYHNFFSTPTTQPIHIIASGAGEVFASPLLLNFVSLIDLNKFPNTTLSINTNGLMSEKNWHRIKHLGTAIKKVNVSVDAARPLTYEALRRGGKWEDINDSLRFLQEQKQHHQFQFHARLIVQQQNYKEILEFYDFCKQFNIDKVEYSRLTNWGTWSQEEFLIHDVFNPTHENYAEAKYLINQVKQFNNVWFEGDFS